jgi:uncharacterized protein YjeT (DUF2065 family)
LLTHFGVILLRADDEKKEIVVKAPSKPVVAPEKKAEKAAEKALEEERYGVLQIPNKVGKYIGILSISVGVFLLTLLAYAGLANKSDWIFLSSASYFPIVDIWIVVGLVSVVAGLVLVGSE